ILFGGASGRFWRYRLATGTADLVEIPTEVVMDRVTAIVAMDDGGFVLGGDGASLLRLSGDTPPVPTVIPLQLDGEPSVRALARIDGDRLLVSANDGQILDVDIGAPAMLPMDTFDRSTNLYDVIVPSVDGRQFYLLGDEGAVLRYRPEDTRFPLSAPLSAGSDEALNGGLVTRSANLLVFGNGDLVALLARETPDDRDIRIAASQGGPVSVQTDLPLVFRRLFTPGSDTVFWQAIVALPNGGLLILGDEGHIVEADLTDGYRAWGDALDDPRIAALQATEALPEAFLALLNSPLFSGQGSFASVQTILQLVEGRRALLEDEITRSEGNLEDVPSWLLGQEQLAFADFIRICREGVVRPSVSATAVAPSGEAAPTVPDAVHLACLQVWQGEMERSEKQIWESLARQIPPGVLLLFLLATLSALYRYNLRLAGFHSSRADVLDLVTAEGGSDLRTFTALSTALAADKVEFARAKTPADQAVELAAALSGAQKK
ncbi:MAG: hypothetical protein WBA67_03560, partial [Jannaschia sp.]